MAKALVTGSSGFVGRHLVPALLSRRYEVDCIDLQSGHDALNTFRARESPVYDLVAHCAYHVGGRATIDYEPRMLALNLQLDAAMFDWAVRTGQKKVLYFSSSAAYPTFMQGSESAHVMLGEPDICLSDVTVGMPDGNYGWAKLTGERMANMAMIDGLPVSIVRPFSGYDDDQSTEYPFGAFLKRAIAREDPFEIWGDGAQVRDWIHIDDVIAGALAIVDQHNLNPINLCTGVGTSMLEVASMMCELVGYSPRFQMIHEAPRGVAYRVGDPSFMNTVYDAKVSLAEGVRRAVDRATTESYEAPTTSGQSATLNGGPS